MKYSKSDVRRKFSSRIQLRFDDQQLTSFSGLIVFQQLFGELSLRRRIAQCFSHRADNRIFTPASMVLLLVVTILLGYRRLRDVDYLKDDQMVLRTVGVSSLPHYSTISRHLSDLDDHSVLRVERLQQQMVLDALSREKIPRITLDFDGSVLGTNRYAQGVASGFNRKKKGQRSYYPLYCTVAQTAQVLAVKHRSGNVHDSNGAASFIKHCVAIVRESCQDAVIETRMDGAFFSEALIALLDQLAVEYTISVPFERYMTIKSHIEQRKRWRPMREYGQFFEKSMSLKSWSIARHRFIFVRQLSKIQNKEPVQLDLFEPHDFDHQYKAVVTNKTTKAAHVIDFHEGRGSQEGLFATLKSQAAMGYIPCKHWNANKLFLLCNVLAHNLTNELQMRHHNKTRTSTRQRPALWVFRQIGTLRKQIIQRAGRLIRPQGVLTLSMPVNDSVRHDLMQYIDT